MTQDYRIKGRSPVIRPRASGNVAGSMLYYTGSPRAPLGVAAGYDGMDTVYDDLESIVLYGATPNVSYDDLNVAAQVFLIPSDAYYTFSWAMILDTVGTPASPMLVRPFLETSLSPLWTNQLQVVQPLLTVSSHYYALGSWTGKLAADDVVGFWSQISTSAGDDRMRAGSLLTLTRIG